MLTAPPLPAKPDYWDRLYYFKMIELMRQIRERALEHEREARRIAAAK